MNIDVIMRRWIDILARLWLGWQERRRARHWLKVTRVGSEWILEDAKKSTRSTSAAGSAGIALPDEIVRAAQKSFVILELPAPDIVSDRKSVV